MIYKFQVFPTECVEEKGGGVIITVETVDYHGDSLDIINTVIEYIEKIHNLKGKDGKKRTDLSIQKFSFMKREIPQGEKGNINKID